MEEAAQVAFNNLLLLGLDVEDVEARYGCSLDPSTFTASSCPQKPVEVVLHFLMVRAYPSEMAQAFKLLWPVVDAAQGREFRKVVAEKLTGMQKAKDLPGTPIIRASIIDAGCGAKFCWTLLHLSRFVLRAAMPNGCPNLSFATPPTLPPGAEGVEALLRLSRLQEAAAQDAFLTDVRASAAAHARWKEFDSKCTARLAEVVRKRADVKAALEEEMGAAPLDVEHVAERVTAAANRLDAHWAAVAPLTSHTAPSSRAVQRVLLDGDAPTTVILPATYAPTALSPGAPELEGLLQRWAACLSQVQRQLTHHSAGREGLRLLGEAADGAQRAAHQGSQGLEAAHATRRNLHDAHHETLASAATLRETLAAALPSEPYTAASLNASHSLNVSLSSLRGSPSSTPAKSEGHGSFLPSWEDDHRPPASRTSARDLPSRIPTLRGGDLASRIPPPSGRRGGGVATRNPPRRARFLPPLR
ncbi:HAUS augmin-like complex subunit 6 N-terminus-domain-containing protein [Baffinella frigidus]|nr:HAUS augmin-like complex subunit 6 N-terminus-domain-containing protein [Cryptophyta sp. CCMP2293]